MSFNIALSGIAAAQKDLDTTANNIANVNTTGFKESRAEFADIYASSMFTNNKTKVGDGVATSRIAQQFNQGGFNSTNNSLDLMIQGEGFFATTNERSGQELTYTRAGAFKMNPENFMVDNNGNFLRGYPVDTETGETLTTSLNSTIPIAIPASAGAPRETANWYLTANFDSRKSPIDPAVTAFDPTDRSTFHDSTSQTVYDSLGGTHEITTYFRRIENTTDTPPNTQWEVHVRFDGQAIVTTPGDPAATPPVPAVTLGHQTIQFLPNGTPATVPVADFVLPASVGTPPVAGTGINGLLSNGAQYTNPINIKFSDPSGSQTLTQFAAKFEPTNTSQDGTTVGYLTGVEINAEGKVVASYSNGEQNYLAQVSIVRFANPQGLKQVGNTSWKQSIDSGEPLAGTANSGTFGTIRSSALEMSNVNLTTELVDLIAAQRNFQANSRALEVNSTLQSTVLQIR